MPGLPGGARKAPNMSSRKPLSSNFLIWVTYLFNLYELDFETQTQMIDELLETIDLNLIKEKFPEDFLFNEAKLDVSDWFSQQKNQLEDWEWIILYMLYGRLNPIMEYKDDLSHIVDFIFHETNLLCDSHVNTTLGNITCPFCDVKLDLTIEHISDDNIIDHTFCTDIDVMNQNSHLKLKVTSNGVPNALDSIFWKVDESGYGFDVEID